MVSLVAKDKPGQWLHYALPKPQSIRLLGGRSKCAQIGFADYCLFLLEADVPDAALNG